MKNENQNIALQAVEFWSTVCEVELDLEEMIEDVFYSLFQSELISVGTHERLPARGCLLSLR